MAFFSEVAFTDVWGGLVAIKGLMLASDQFSTAFFRHCAWAAGSVLFALEIYIYGRLAYSNVTDGSIRDPRLTAVILLLLVIIAKFTFSFCGLTSF